jgi:hypothetical protein
MLGRHGAKLFLLSPWSVPGTDPQKLMAGRAEASVPRV